ncbi:hypothetical protein [Pelagimonas varians]|uniref:Uncharacterized protein n=1 Tax=Pelagimonas varians TaxID=696760 RepID=A0A238K0K6_9RHOB|nr:hypothetical protein [Pelagimonas varians]PYG33030.1 hypothetical protein C8N36_10224 [Pelagimonas varians]SMX35496.1 hypothetical protein PEV8663_00486 [Pelagimonas varians]
MSAKPPPKWLNSSLTLLLVALSTCVLISKTYDAPTASAAARGLFVTLCLFGLRYGSIREWLLAAVAATLALILTMSNPGSADLNAAADLAAFFAAFIVLLTVLKVAAERSRSILAVGRFLTSQPPGRRFYATALGGHVLGVFLNFGAVSLMAPLIQKGAIITGTKPDPDLERRQLSALLRGFSWILLWAPTTLSQAVLLTLFTDVNMSQIFGMGLATAFLMMLLGRMYDRYEWRNAPRRTAAKQAPIPPWRAIGIVGCVCFGLITSTVLLQLSAGYSTALALMFVAPAITIFWFGLQTPKVSEICQHLWKLGPLLAANAAGLTRSAMALGLSGFIGRALAEVLPIEEISNHIDLSALPGWVFLACLPLLITLGGQVAISPIMLVVFLGQVIQTLPVLPAEPTHIVFALSAGWAISMLASPNATATLLIAATSGIAPTTLTWRWNLRYAVLCYAVFVGIFVVLAW